MLYSLLSITLQGFQGQTRADPQEINRQLRDLLQRQQQFKKIDDLVPGKGQQRVWPPVAEEQDGDSAPAVPATSADTTFRQPLPPSMRPRLAAVSTMNRPTLAQAAMKLAQIDPRMQGLDPRTRLILQHQQRLINSPNPTIPHQFIRFPPGVRPATVEQYEQLLQRQTQAPNQQQVHRLPLSQPSVIQRSQLGASHASIGITSAGDSANTEEGIPDNVTAELEKLEQETGKEYTGCNRIGNVPKLPTFFGYILYNIGKTF